MNSDSNNTTDANSKIDSSKTIKKQKKPKGPVRWEAIIPTLAILALVYGYMHFFFDNHLRKGAEWIGTHIHGAEVNIRKIHSSFFGGFLEVHNIQVTNKENLSENLVQIDKIHFDLLWDALLRAKFVVNLASIDGIQVYAPRKTPGKLLPKPPPEPPSKNGNSMASKTLNELEDNVLAQTKETYNQNVLGDVAQIVEGTDPNKQLKSIQENLKSDQYIKDLEKELADKKQKWQEQFNKLPKKQELEGLFARAKAIKIDTKNPLQAAKDIQKLQSIIKEGDQIIKNFNNTSNTLTHDVSSFQSQIKGLDKMIENDVKDLQTRFKIPQIDTGDFSKALFSRMFESKLAGFQKYIAIAREYMPPKKTEEQKKEAEASQLIPRKRGAGKTFRFPVAKGYPLFWIKQIRISSKASPNNEFSGNLTGKVTDITSNQSLVGKPTMAVLQGDFPKQEIFGINAILTMDHRTTESYDKLEANIAQYPLAQKKLSDSNDVKFYLNSAEGSSKLNGVLKNNQLYFSINSEFKKPQYLIEAKSNTVRDILRGTADGIPVIQVNALASGPWSHLSWKLNSNLGDEISKGFKKQVQAKIDEAREKLKNLVNDKINTQKQNLMKNFEGVQSQYNQQIAKVRGELNKAKGDAQKEVNGQSQSAKKSSQDKLKKEGDKALKKLKKAFGF